MELRMDFFGISHRKIQKGNVKEFEKVFRYFYKPLCTYVASILSDWDTAEEIVQELFCTYWNKRKSIEIKSSFKSYLYQWARNRSLKYLAHKKVINSYEKECQETHSIGNVFYDDLELSEFNDLIVNALNSLPERCQKIFHFSRNEK